MKHKIILACSIAAILSFSPHALSASVELVDPVPAYGGNTYPDSNNLTPSDVMTFTSADVNRIQGNIARALARKAPYVDVLAGGTISAGVSQTQRFVVQERAILNQSLCNPTFVPDISACGLLGPAIETGTTEYSYFLGTNRGMGPLVCVKGMRDQFQGSYLAAEDAMKKQIVQLVNSDVRATLTNRSGCKLVAKSGLDFDSLFNGNAQAVDTAFDTAVTGVPDSPLTFSLLDYLGQFMKEDLLVDGFEGPQTEPLLKFIGSQEINTRLRNEIGIRDDHRYLAAGKYEMGKDTLTRYSWEGPYRGYAFGIDPQPLRFSVLDSNGQPVYIEPEIAVPSSQGFAARVNPAWAKARFEIGLVIGADSFSRLTPAQYNGEGGWKFPSQVSMGELIFAVIKDNINNVWGDFGRHHYQIQRAYRPMRPHAVCAVAFKRAVADFGLSPVSDYVDYSSSSQSL